MREYNTLDTICRKILFETRPFYTSVEILEMALSVCLSVRTQLLVNAITGKPLM